MGFGGTDLDYAAQRDKDINRRVGIHRAFEDCVLLCGPVPIHGYLMQCYEFWYDAQLPGMLRDIENMLTKVRLSALPGVAPLMQQHRTFEFCTETSFRDKRYLGGVAAYTVDCMKGFFKRMGIDEGHLYLYSEKFERADLRPKPLVRHHPEMAEWTEGVVTEAIFCHRLTRLLLATAKSSRVAEIRVPRMNVVIPPTTRILADISPEWVSKHTSAEFIKPVRFSMEQRDKRIIRHKLDQIQIARTTGDEQPLMHASITNMHDVTA